MIRERDALSRAMLLNQTLEALALVLEFNMKDHPSHQHAIRVGEGCVLIGEKMGHSTRVSILSGYIARKMELPSGDIVKIEVAGLLHDAGKISVPVEILDKPGLPSQDEWEIIKGHPNT